MRVPSTVTLPDVLLDSGLKWGVGSALSAGVGVAVAAGLIVGVASGSDALWEAALTGPTRVAVTKTTSVKADLDRCFLKATGLADFAGRFKKDLFINIVLNSDCGPVFANNFRASREKISPPQNNQIGILLPH